MGYATLLLATAIATLGDDPGPDGLRMEPVNGRWFRVEPGKPATLRWKGTEAGKAGPLRFIVRDYAGTEEAAGTLAVRDGSPTLDRTFSQGYHEIELPGLKRRFGLIAATAFSGRPDPFFAIDGALTWLTADDRVRQALIAEARDAGITLVRERVRWGSIQPAKDRWAWDADGKADGLRLAFRRADLPILEMAHDAPAWTGLEGVYPGDLAATADSWREIGRRWQKTWGGVELWNEPDIQFGGDRPADQYAAFGKAAATGLRAAGIDAPIVAGVVSNFSPDFQETLAGSGLLERADAFSFHDYGSAIDLESKTARFRNWLRNSGRPDMPLWLTECGWPWKRGAERPTAEEDVKSAGAIAAKAVEARACGVARYFPFVLPYYEENANNFGMTDRGGSPLRSFAAYAQTIRALAGLEYLGDLKVEGSEIGRARVFGDGKAAVVVLLAAKPTAMAKLPGLTILHIEGADGREVRARDDESFEIADGLAFVRVDQGTLGDRLVVKTAAMSLRPAKTEVRAKPSSIVVRPHLDPARFLTSTSGYRIKDSGQTRTDLAAEVWNLGDEAESIELTLHLEGARTDRPRRQIQAGPHQKVVATWSVDLKGSLVGFRPIRATLEAEGTGGLLDRAEFRVGGEPSLESALAGLSHPTRLPIDDLTRWKPSISAGGILKVEPLPPAGCRLRIVDHPKGDRWAYPEFRLPDGVSMRNARALIVRARCEKSAQVRAFFWEGESGVGYLTPSPIIQADAAWHVARIELDRLVLSSANEPDPDEFFDRHTVRRISLGMNNEHASNALEISDLYVEWPGDEIGALWKDLEKDEVEASRALLILSTRPAEVVPFLKEQLRPLRLDAVRLKAYLLRLVSPNEALAKKAFEDLEYFDPRLAMDLTALMEKTTETPMRQRLVEVLSGRERGSLKEIAVELRSFDNGKNFNFFQPNVGSWWAERDLSLLNTRGWGDNKRKWTRAVRAIALLEHIGTPEARKILEDMATGHPDALPTRVAAEAVRRLRDSRP
ncbi:cellulase family glycosylhydrolase [Aquisphaera insulae]|uniref:cellulase family glycosylhydrolase n=1 Tax=Aquisphaera insulae TaxID=2712864 RepID=UPI0013EB1F7E|nr:cellulase family glycosylhydrolase [Aquisphaera insulae]